MDTFIAKFEKLVYLILIILLGVVILFSISELIGLIYSGLFVESIYRLDNHELVNLFGFFLLVIIGIELLETLKDVPPGKHDSFRNCHPRGTDCYCKESDPART